MVDVSDLPALLPRIKPAGQRSAEEAELLRTLAASESWYHVLDLGDGIVTNGVFDVASTLRHYRLDSSYEGRRVLDVGSSNGFYSIEFARRGASEVVALDLPSWERHDWTPRKLAELRQRSEAERRTTDSITLAGACRIAAKASGVQSITFEESAIYELAPERHGRFDVVFCGAMLMHVRDPLLGLHAIRSVLRSQGRLVLSSSIARHLEHAEQPEAVFVGAWDQCNFWQFSPRCLVWMLAAADFELVGDPHCFDAPARRDGFVDRLCVVHARPRADSAHGQDG